MENILHQLISTIDNPTPTEGIQVGNQLSPQGSSRRHRATKRRRPLEENHHTSSKRLGALVVQTEELSISSKEPSNSDNINLNVCLASDMSANRGSHCVPLAPQDVLMEIGNKDIFTFTETVVSFTPPADRISGMDFASEVLPIRVVNVCVLASPLLLELASSVD